MTKLKLICVLATATVLSTGCGSSEPAFQSSKLRIRKIETDLGLDDGLSPTLYQSVADVLAAMFGTPNRPHFIVDADAGTDGFVDPTNLSRAAGPVTRDLSGEVMEGAPHLSVGAGLYRQHCVHCHAVTGNGKGPTASFLNPYPRDFTLAKFKFGSTPLGIPPTEADLHRVLMMGIEGTAMPSFALLDRGEVTALVDYLKYLTARGQMERELITEAADAEEIDISKEGLVDGKLADIVASWKEAESVAPPEPSVPLYSEDPAAWSTDKKNELFASVDRGRDLYFTVDANCFSCHGQTQLGDGNLGLYDEWAKELHDWQGDGKVDPEKLAEHLSLGGLEPRIVEPRNLRLGQYRGGRRPIDIYWRIRNGIDGTGMPGATLKTADPNSKGVSEDDIWDLVNFVLSLPYEPASRPDSNLPVNERYRSS